MEEAAGQPRPDTVSNECFRGSDSELARGGSGPGVLFCRLWRRGYWSMDFLPITRAKYCGSSITSGSVKRSGRHSGVEVNVWGATSLGRHRRDERVTDTVLPQVRCEQA